MNDQDKEAFEKWVESEDRHDGVFGNNNNFTRDSWIAEMTWQAACEYKQKEIDKLTKYVMNLKNRLVPFSSYTEIGKIVEEIKAMHEISKQNAK